MNNSANLKKQMTSMPAQSKLVLGSLQKKEMVFEEVAYFEADLKEKGIEYVYSYNDKSLAKELAGFLTPCFQRSPKLYSYTVYNGKDMWHKEHHDFYANDVNLYHIIRDMDSDVVSITKVR